MQAVMGYSFHTVFITSVHSRLHAGSFLGFPEFFDHAFINTEILPVSFLSAVIIFKHYFP